MSLYRLTQNTEKKNYPYSFIYVYIYIYIGIHIIKPNSELLIFEATLSISHLNSNLIKYAYHYKLELHK